MPILNTGYNVICSHSIGKYDSEVIVMIAITEKEETALDNGFLQTTKDNQTFTIYNNKEQSDVICYGMLDLSTNSDDYNVIEGMNFLDHCTGLGISVPANYNYKKHCCYSHNHKYMTYDTTNPAVLIQWKHGLIGKPERVCIFKEKHYGFVTPK